MVDTLNVVFPRKLLKEFITLYEKLPCLWDKHCISYKMRNKRHEAITKLTELVQEYDPSATRVHTMRKIESLRACVRREYKRVQHSKTIATDESEVYTPHLWYYDLFSFMFHKFEQMDADDKAKPESPASPKLAIVESEHEEDSQADDGDDEQNENSMDSFSGDAFSISSTVVEVPGASKRFLDDDKGKRHCTEVDDEYDAIGINVAAKLRNLPGNTRILAEKLINDVLYQAQTNALTNATHISTPDPFKMESAQRDLNFVSVGPETSRIGNSRAGGL